MEEILLVEPAEAVSENVKEANTLRTDPLSATRLVSTPAQIKEKINSKMSPEGRYIFNDQFSEATVTDINGNNLLNNEYYSFISKDNGKLFMSKNNPENDIVEFNIADKKVIEQEPIETSVEESNEIVETPIEENTKPVENINEGFAKEDIDLGKEVSIPTTDIAPKKLSSMFSAPTQIPAEEVETVTRGLSSMFNAPAQIPAEEVKTVTREYSSMFGDINSKNIVKAPATKNVDESFKAGFTGMNDETGSESFDEIKEEVPATEINSDDVVAENEEKEIEDVNKEDVSDLDKLIDAKDAELEKANAKIEELTRQIDSMSSMLNNLKEEDTKDLKEEASEEDMFSKPEIDNIDSYEEEYSDLEDDSYTDTEEDEYEEPINNPSIDEANKKVDDIIDKTVEIREENDRLKEENESLKEENENLKEKLKAVKKNVDKKVQAYEFKTSALETKVQTLETTVDKVNDEKNQMEAKYESQLRAKDNVIDLTKRENDKLKIENKKYQKEARGWEEVANRLFQHTDALLEDEDIRQKVA